MFGKGLRLYKREKLCSVTAIDRLFAARTAKGVSVADPRGRIAGVLCYPLRMVYAENNSRSGAPVEFLVSIPKKRLRRAVDRATLRRRIRESYRLHRGNVEDIQHSATPIDVAFIYVADRMVDYQRVYKAMDTLLKVLRGNE